MGKKIKKEMDEQRAAFIFGATENGLTTKLASEVFDQISAFAGYGFNKSHAAAYALVAYQTAYLKANFTAEFLAASMDLDSGNTTNLRCRQECLKIDKILPPDVNKSRAGFTVETMQDKKRRK